MNKLNNIPKLWKDSLDLSEEFFSTLLRKDREIMYCFSLATASVRVGKHAHNPDMVRRKIKAIKNEYIEAFLYSYLKKKDIIIKLKNKLIMEYDFSKRTKENEYQLIMKELDSLLVSTKHLINDCQCSGEGFGFCFCTEGL